MPRHSVGGLDRLATALGLLAALLLAFAVRAAMLHAAFPGDGSVVLAMDDASYHARRAFYSFVRFPAVLWSDPYLNYPIGSPVPWPPGYDWALAAVARMFGSSEWVFERVVAWASPVLAALTTLPVYAVGRRLGGRGLGLGAAAIFALLPASALYSRVGNPDHHAAVGLLGTSVLALTLVLVHGELRRWRLVLTGSAWALAWLGLLLTWSGSLLYIALGHGLVGLVAVWEGRRDLLAVQAAAALAVAACVTPFVIASQPVLGGPFSSVNLSWFHVWALLAVAAVAAGTTGLEAWRPAADPWVRTARAALLGGVLLAAIVAFLATREALTTAGAFFTKQDAWGNRSIEGRSMFAGGRISVSQYGLFTFLLPLAALAAWARARERSVRVPALVFAAWGTALGILAVGEVRFASDFAPSAAVMFAMLLAAAHRGLARRWPARRALLGMATVLAGAGLLGGPILQIYLPEASLSLQRLRGSRQQSPRYQVSRSIDAFARSLRTLTPETAAFLDPDGRPEYSVLTRAAFGHAVKWAGRRPTTVDPFGTYLDRASFDQVDVFLNTRDEDEAFATARSLGARYFLSAAYYVGNTPDVERRLHVSDGLATPGNASLGHFRLVGEGPMLRPGLPGSVPHKLFEVVEGALLEARAAPGTGLYAELTLETPLGRRLRWTGRSVADAEGVARLRVPYPTAGDAPVRALGPWRLRVGAREQVLEVSEADVREGRRLELRP